MHVFSTILFLNASICHFSDFLSICMPAFSGISVPLEFNGYFPSFFLLSWNYSYFFIKGLLKAWLRNKFRFIRKLIFDYTLISRGLIFMLVTLMYCTLPQFLRSYKLQDFDLRYRGCQLEPHWRHYIVSLSKTLYPLLSTGSSQEDPSRHNRKIVDWDVKKKQTNKLQDLSISMH